MFNLQEFYPLHHKKNRYVLFSVRPRIKPRAFNSLKQFILDTFYWSQNPKLLIVGFTKLPLQPGWKFLQKFIKMTTGSKRSFYLDGTTSKKSFSYVLLMLFVIKDLICVINFFTNCSFFFIALRICLVLEGHKELKKRYHWIDKFIRLSF